MWRNYMRSPVYRKEKDWYSGDRIMLNIIALVTGKREPA